MKKVKVTDYFGVEYEISDVHFEFTRLDVTGELSYSLVGKVQFLHDSIDTLLLVSTNPQDILKEYDRLKHELDLQPDDLVMDDEMQQVFHSHLLEI